MSRTLTFPLTCHPFSAPYISSKPISFRGALTLKSASFIGGSVVRGSTVKKFGVFVPKNMTQMSRTVDFGGGGDGAAESGGFLETEAVLGSGSSELRRDFDSGGLESLLNRLSKWMVAAVFGIVLLWKHDAEAMWAAMGCVLNSVLSVTLKRILNHERPAPALRSDPGMPSSHAQSISYAATFAFLSLVQWLGINAVTVTIGVFVLISASYMSYLRVSQKFHTVSQVLVGAALGSLCACAWFWLWRSFVLKAFISSIWVRLVVILGSATFCLAFLIYVVQHWLDDEP